MVFLYVHVVLFSYSPHILFFSFLPLSRLLLELSELIWFQAVYFSSVLALYLFQLLLHIHQLSVFLLDSCMLSLLAWSDFEVDGLKIFFELLDLMVFQSELAVQSADLSLKVDLLLSQLLLVFLHLSLWSFFVSTVTSILQSLHHFLVHPLFALQSFRYVVSFHFVMVKFLHHESFVFCKLGSHLLNVFLKPLNRIVFVLVYCFDCGLPIICCFVRRTLASQSPDWVVLMIWIVIFHLQTKF